MTLVDRDQLMQHAELVIELLTVDADTADEPRRQLIGVQVVRSLDRLLAAAEEPGSPRRADPPVIDIPDPSARRRDYRLLVARVRERLLASVPTGATVAIVSKGDSQLLDLPGLGGVHLPQDDRGTWAGYHPADGADALAHLLALRDGGAQYLAIPSPSRWWLDHYGALQQHLVDHATVLVDDDDLLLFHLDDPPVPPAPSIGDVGYDSQTRHFTELVDALLPAGACVLVVTRGDDAFLRSRRVTGRHFPSDGAGTYLGHPADDEQAVAVLDEAIHHGGEYLGIPSPQSWWSDAYPAFWRHVRTVHRCIAERAESGVLFELIPRRTRP